MTATYVGRRRRADGVEPCAVLVLAILARQASGSTHARKVSEADCPNGAGCELHPLGHDRRARTR